MDRQDQEWKTLKKACKNERRKYGRIWKTLGILFLVTAILLSGLSAVVLVMDNAFGAFLGGSFWKLENEDPKANYYTVDFESHDDRTAYGQDICYQVEAEGAVLLMNNGALPLKAGAKVSTLSTSSVNLVYGGAGASNVDLAKIRDLKTTLEETGFSVNPTLWDFYQTGPGADYSRDAGFLGSIWTAKCNISEAPWSRYTEEVKSSIANYADAAIVTISRVGLRGADMEHNYLQLDENEKSLLEGLNEMKAAGQLDAIILLLNTANPLQMDFLKSSRYGADAILWTGGLGANGTSAVCDILAGKVNPSGSTVDTYCYDNFSAPAMKNTTPVTYGGYVEEEERIPQYAKSYMIYQEGIYVGYKYYETRYEDYVMGKGNAGEYDYRSMVAFPFGHGLSYTEFAYTDLSVAYQEQEDSFAVTVTVTNTGDVAGKETVQVYAQSPYTEYDIQNGVEKAAVGLAGFSKTAVLAPGASETVTVLVDKRELASFDTYGAGTYILDAGDYYLTVATDAHQAVNNILTAKGFSPENTDGRMDEAGNGALVHKWTQATFDGTTYATSLNGTPITGRLSEADPNLYAGTQGQTVLWLSRSNWTGTYPSDTPVVLQLTEELTRDLQRSRYDAGQQEAVPMPVLGANNGMKLAELIGKDYDDPQWQTLLDQLTFRDMVSMIGDSFHYRMPVASVQAPGTRDENGAEDLSTALFGSVLEVETTAFPSAGVLAATFNCPLMYEVGRVIGNDCLAADIVCMYGPGANMHRTPFGGRNFEYFAEDSFLSGAICAAEVRGIQDKGVDVVIKHFALNESEQDRMGLGVWLNEQAAREIYLKAYQEALEEAGANGVMTAYTRWGAVWSGGYAGLMTGILRQEWGSNGMSITDNVITPLITGVDGVLAGTTTYDALTPSVTMELWRYEEDPVVVTAMREACHRNLYALANSSAMNGIGPETVIRVKPLPLAMILLLSAVAVWLLFIGAVALWAAGNRKWKRSEAYLNYITRRNTLKEQKS